jgi:hypothetical protein
VSTLLLNFRHTNLLSPVVRRVRSILLRQFLRSPPAHTFAPYLRRVRELLTQTARTNIFRQQSRWRQRYDRYRSNPAYSVGDHVYVAILSGRAKLDSRRLGPCIVLQRSGDQTYFIRDTVTGRTQWAHINHLHPVTPRDHP